MNKKTGNWSFAEDSLFRFSLFLKLWENCLSRVTNPLAEHCFQLNIFITDDKIRILSRFQRAFTVIDP